MDDQTEYIDTLIALHRGLDRQGPGDIDFARQLLRSLPPLPPQPRIADLGCGSGAGALLLAEHYQSSVLAVDASAVFIEELQTRARAAGLEQWITAIVADMGQLGWPPGSIDLLWSEGAAYNLGFEQALSRWRPLLAEGGVAVVSELSWFTDAIPATVWGYWQAAYAGIGSEADNRQRAKRAGYRVVATSRLPSQAWWTNYYGPLRSRLNQLNSDISSVAQTVVQETEAEMALFQQFSDIYGYTFYILSPEVEHR